MLLGVFAVSGSIAYRRAAWFACAIVFAISGLALFGWSFDIQQLKSFGLGPGPMRMPVVLCFLASAAALALTTRRETRRNRVFCQTLGALVLLVASLSLLCYLSAFWSGHEPGWLA